MPLRAARCPGNLPATGSNRTFIAGAENALVRSLVAAAIETSPAFNPLVLCGASGVGKTSVASALAAMRREKLGLKQVISTTGSDLYRGLANAIDSDASGDFRSRFHRCEVLVIDELQRLAGKPAAQQFLVAALDALVKRGSLVIATLPRLPQNTDGLSPALVSRLSGGLIVTLQSPGSEARRRLVQLAAEEFDLPLTDAAVAQLAGLGEQLSLGSLSTAPRLRQAVMQLAANASGSSKTHPRMPAVDPTAADPKATFRETTVVVARHFDLTLSELKGKSRQQHIADARALAMFVARRLTGSSYARIGRFFGGRDHSTVLHACQKTERRLASDDAAHRLLDELVAHISTQFAVSPSGATEA